MIQMIGHCRVRFPQKGKGESSQDAANFAKFLEFMEFKRMNQLVIKEGSEAGSSDITPPQKIIKTDDSTDENWIQVKGKA